MWGSTRIDSRTFIIQYFLNDLFFITEDTDIASYPDDNTL